LKKNIIIDGDKFQKEYKRQYKKELITDLVQGIIFLIIAISGLFFGDKLLLKLFIYIFPLFILTYAVNLFSLGMGAINKHRNQGISFFIQALLYALFAVYIFLNPISSLGYVLSFVGAAILINAVVKMIYFPNYVPLGSLLGAGILILFADSLINLFYNMAMVLLLFFGISKISKFIYSIKNN
jgi:hypothetical protein